MGAIRNPAPQIQNDDIENIENGGHRMMPLKVHIAQQRRDAPSHWCLRARPIYPVPFAPSYPAIVRRYVSADQLGVRV